MVRGKIQDYLQKLRNYFPEFYVGWSWSFTETGWRRPVSKYEFFTDKESEGLDDSFMRRLVIARRQTIILDPSRKGVPFIITSGRRTLLENQQIPGAVGDSSHLTGHAVDLACSQSQERFFILSALLIAGFNRIGIYEKHIHVDDDSAKDQNVVWFIASA